MIKQVKYIVTAVKHLHTLGITHRDLEQENIFLSNNDVRNFEIKISGFDFARQTKIAKQEMKNSLKQPKFPTNPKAIKYEQYDISCDIWSLGLLLQKLCLFSLSFNLLTPLSPMPDMKIPDDVELNISTEVYDLIKRMLDPNPNERITIDDILNNEWMRRFVIDTDLIPRDDCSIQFKERNFNSIKLKSLKDSSNKILDKRRWKKINTRN